VIGSVSEGYAQQRINSLQIFQTTCGNFERRSEFAIEIVFGY
jgi:hypothetical protein